MKVEPGGRVLVEVGANRYAFGTATIITSEYITVALDDECGRSDTWHATRVRPVEVR